MFIFRNHIFHFMKYYEVISYFISTKKVRNLNVNLRIILI